MKKIIGLFSLVMAVTISSCSNESKETKKEVIMVPVEKKEPVVVKEPKPTSITLDKNGVKVETKKVKVDIKQN